MAGIERSDPPYLQIANQIRGDIESGAIELGDAIPSVRQIMERYEVANATGTKVHAHLRSLGLVESRPGVGTVVRARTVNGGGQQHMRSASTLGKIYGGKKKARIVSSELVSAPDHVAIALGVSDGTQVIRRERVTYAGETPVAKSVSWLPGKYADAAPLLLEAERIPKGTFGYLADTVGLQLSTGRDMISAGAANGYDASALGIPEGSPVLLQRSWFRAESGEVLEYGEGVNPADYWVTYDYTA